MTGRALSGFSVLMLQLLSVLDYPPCLKDMINQNLVIIGLPQVKLCSIEHVSTLW